MPDRWKTDDANTADMRFHISDIRYKSDAAEFQRRQRTCKHDDSTISICDSAPDAEADAEEKPRTLSGATMIAKYSKARGASTS